MKKTILLLSVVGAGIAAWNGLATPVATAPLPGSKPGTDVAITMPSPEVTGAIPRAENQAIYRQYEALAATRSDVSFVGRLATYRYYNMDQVVGQALATYRRMTVQKTGAPVGTGAAASPTA